ncbi:MAG: alpha/beta hydrolase [Paludibacter sp.]
MKKTLLFLLVLFCNSLFSQNQVLKVWPGLIPGEIKSETYKEKKTGSNDAIHYSKVTVPTLTVFPAKSGNNCGAAMVICPGGGYRQLAFDHEGIKVAQYFNNLGISAFVLKYRLPSDSIMQDKSVAPMQDVQEAIRLVRRSASQYGIDPNKVGVIGFSAGGHLASTAATHFQEKVYNLTDTTSARPDFAVLVYPVITMGTLCHKGSRENLLGKNPTPEQIARFSNELQVTPQTPPVFIVHASDDKTVPVQNSINFYLACLQNKVPAEMHLYQKGGHGFGLAAGISATQAEWPQALAAWLKSLKITNN